MNPNKILKPESSVFSEKWRRCCCCCFFCLWKLICRNNAPQNCGEIPDFCFICHGRFLKISSILQSMLFYLPKRQKDHDFSISVCSLLKFYNFQIILETNLLILKHSFIFNPILPEKYELFWKYFPRILLFQIVKELIVGIKCYLLHNVCCYLFSALA